jgi:oligo-1,6-glucosidase
MQFSSRDNGRTPFPWNEGPNAGFTTGKPWIKLASNYPTINEAAEEIDSNSCLSYFRKLVRLRKEYVQVFVYGKYTLLDKTNPSVYAYQREGGGQKLLILLNFSTGAAQARLAQDISHAKLLLSNDKVQPLFDKPTSRVTLNPYQAVIYKL